ncbi:MAG: energy-coupling factor ABC transporter permease [Rudaea sp.]
MDLIGLAFPAPWPGIGFAVAIPLLGWAGWRARWRRLEGEHIHVWLATILGLALLWSVKASLASGLVFHLLGVPLFTLLAGPWLALIGTAIAVAVVTIAGDGSWINGGLAVLALGVAPVVTTTVVLRAAERWLPPNPFVYIFVAAFFGPALAMLTAGTLVALGTIAAEALPAPVVFQFLPYLLHLAFGEATVTGMLVTLLVVYRPAWVGTFDNARYLRER